MSWNVLYKRIVRSSLLGIENLKRIVPQILQWTTTGEKGQTYEEASRLYYAVINQWNNYLYHVLANIGGIYIENTTVGDGIKTYTFVEKEKQQVADIKSGYLPPFFVSNEPGGYACMDSASLLLCCRVVRYLVRPAKQKRSARMPWHS